MQDYLIVVDMQNDFVTGALGTQEAVSIVECVKHKIDAFHGTVIYTRDTHEENYMETQEGKNLPVPHCTRDTWGWQIIDALEECQNHMIFDKPTFGSLALASYLKEQGANSVTLIGLCTDICVISNAMLIKASLPETQIIVDAACCAGVSPESHLRALDAMKMCQIQVVNER